jgi:acetylornithine aminotransferase
MHADASLPMIKAGVPGSLRRHAVISIGHSHPVYVKALTEQLQRIGFYSNAIVNPLQEKLAEALTRISGYTGYTLFLCNSGAEATKTP